MFLDTSSIAFLGGAEETDQIRTGEAMDWGGGGGGALTISNNFCAVNMFSSVYIKINHEVQQKLP